MGLIEELLHKATVEYLLCKSHLNRCSLSLDPDPPLLHFLTGTKLWHLYTQFCCLQDSQVEKVSEIVLLLQRELQGLCKSAPHPWQGRRLKYYEHKKANSLWGCWIQEETRTEGPQTVVAVQCHLTRSLCLAWIEGTQRMDGAWLASILIPSFCLGGLGWEVGLIIRKHF